MKRDGERRASVLPLFDLSLEGLYADTPTVAAFRQRIGVLVDRFT